MKYILYQNNLPCDLCEGKNLGGIWVGGNDLAHLTFGTKSSICKTNTSNCENSYA